MDGLTYVRPDGERRLELDVYGSPEELKLTDNDILVLATKTQDAADALQVWAQQPVTLGDGNISTAGRVLPILTTQNGLETERVALRHFRRVIGGVLALGAHYVEPGVVVALGVPAVGLVWIGAYPDRSAPELEPLARNLRRANLETRVVDRLSAWKHAKLVGSVTFVLDALYEPSALRDRAAALLKQEVIDTIAAGDGEIADLGAAMRGSGQRQGTSEMLGNRYGGTSTWQSLSRAGSLETDYLNGEVVLQARLLGRTAPANRALTVRIHAAARAGIGPRSLGDDDLLQTLPQLAESSSADALHDAASDVLIDALTLHRQLRGTNPPAVLDVRWKLGDPDGRLNYSAVHIPTAVYVDLDTELAAPPSAAAGRHPLPELDALQAAARRWGVREGQPVVVYDNAGGLSAARAWWLLRWAGIEDVKILDGALGRWIAAGLPLASGTLGVPLGDVRLSADCLPTLDAAQAAQLPDSGILLDARAAERYRGESEPIDPQAGHIPGAINVPTQQNLDEQGRFLPSHTLRARFAALGIDESTSVGVYCGSGVTAAHLLAALQVAGFEATLFPGSWSAWSANPDRPVAVGAAPS